MEYRPARSTHTISCLGQDGDSRCVTYSLRNTCLKDIKNLRIKTCLKNGDASCPYGLKQALLRLACPHVCSYDTGGFQDPGECYFSFSLPSESGIVLGSRSFFRGWITALSIPFSSLITPIRLLLSHSRWSSLDLRKQ